MLMTMGVVSSAGRYPARQQLRINKAKELELVRQISPTARHWPDVFVHTSGIVSDLNKTLSPIKLANEVITLGERLRALLTDTDGQYGIVVTGRKGKRGAMCEAVVMSHGHPIIDEGGISLWSMVIMVMRSGTRFQTTCTANLSEHALGRWHERGREMPPDIVGAALLDCAKVPHVLDWQTLSERTNEFNVPVGDVLLSGVVRNITPVAASGGARQLIRQVSWLMDVRTVLDAASATPLQLRQSEEIARAIEPVDILGLGVVDISKRGPITGCPVPMHRVDVLDKTYDGEVRWREW